ncbi:MAG: alpha/beta hydrolase [Ahrensia sp.]
MTQPDYTPGGESTFISARDGLKLHVRIYKPSVPTTALPVICLPGLSRNGRDFDLLARHLSTDAKTPRAVYCLDFRGRGLSGYDSNWSNYNILTEAEDTVMVLTALGLAHGVFVGTSRGGLVTMIMSALRPGAIKGVVFNDIGPVIEGAGLTQIRLYLQRQPKPTSWANAAELQRSVMAKAFTAMDPDEWMREAHARYRSFDGTIRPDHDPNLIKTLTGIDLEARLPTMWPQFDGLRHAPLMIIRGGNSTLLSEKTVEAMVERHPKATAITAQNQGHAPLLTKADTIGPIAEFIRSIKH